MQIDDLTAGLSLSFLINLNTEQLQFESKILEVYPRRHTLLAQGVFTDDKIISFRGKGLVVDLIERDNFIISKHTRSCSKTLLPM